MCVCVWGGKCVYGRVMEQNGKLEYGNGILMHILLHRIYSLADLVVLVVERERWWNGIGI